MADNTEEHGADPVPDEVAQAARLWVSDRRISEPEYAAWANRFTWLVLRRIVVVGLVAAIIGAAPAALLAVSLLIVSSAALLPALVSPEMPGRLAIVAFAIDLAYGAAGGYLAARIGRAAPIGASFVFGVLGVSLTLMSAGDAHGWYRPGLLLLLMPATVSGGWLRTRHLARRSHES